MRGKGHEPGGNRGASPQAGRSITAAVPDREHVLGLLAAVSAGHGYVEVHSRLLENCDATLDVKVRRAAAYTLASLDEEAQTISAELVARFRTEDDAAAEVWPARRALHQARHER